MTGAADGAATRGAAIRAEGWGWRHAGRDDWAVRGLDLRIEAGERVLLLGRSGAGKSTLLHGLGGVLGGQEDGDEAGRLLIDGDHPHHRRDRIGMVLQDPDSQVILSRVGDDVAFGMENLRVPRADIWGRVRAALDRVGLGVPLGHDTAELSGGQKQRLALAGVLAMRPGLILLDEPTANLDPDGVREVRDAVAAVAAETETTLIVVEHRTEVWLPVVDRVVVLGPQGIVADGAPDDVLARESGQLAEAGIWVPGAPALTLTRSPAPASSPALLTGHALGVGYRAVALPARLDLEIRAGRTTAVTGPNGAGKSTLALTLGGLLPAASGRLDAAEEFSPSPKRRTPAQWRSTELLSRIGSVFQDPEHQFVARSVREELAVGPRALGRSAADIARDTDGLLERLRLAPLADANPYTLSGGEKRRLSVATVLTTRPALVVLDEPTFGQDRRTWEELVLLLAELVDGGTAVVAVTHDLPFVDALADDRVVLPAWSAGSGVPR